MRVQGRAFDGGGTALPTGTTIHAFVDGVDISNGAAVQDGLGSYAVLVEGNSKDNGNVSDTPGVQEGANLGDRVIYAAGNFTAATGVFEEAISWSPGVVRTQDLHLGSTASTPQPAKIQGIVTRPAQHGNQFVLVCNPTSGPLSLADYYLERNAPGIYRGPTMSLAGVLAAGSTVLVDLPSTSWLTPSGDALKLVYRNPDGAAATAAGLDIVVDRVEFNATAGGTLFWEPANTLLGDAPAPTVGRILERDAACTDTNRPTDFSLGIEPGLPPNGAPTVRVVTPAPGQEVPAAASFTFTWTIADDVFQAADLRVWANVTVGNETTPLLAGDLGATSAVWMSPDLAIEGAVLRVDVVDPFGARASDARTFNITRQSPWALLIAVLLALVLAAFLVFGFLRAKKREQGPPLAPPSPPTAPTPPVAPALPTAMRSDAAKKVCPRCHTAVSAIDVRCFFCGYEFPPPSLPP